MAFHLANVSVRIELLESLLVKGFAVEEAFPSFLAMEVVIDCGHLSSSVIARAFPSLLF